MDKGTAVDTRVSQISRDGKPWWDEKTMRNLTHLPRGSSASNDAEQMVCRRDSTGVVQSYLLCLARLIRRTLNSRVEGLHDARGR